MRPLLVMAATAAAFALWVWLTGPGTSLPLALGGGLFALLAGRLAYRLLTPATPDTDINTGPERPKGTGERDV